MFFFLNESTLFVGILWLVIMCSKWKNTKQYFQFEMGAFSCRLKLTLVCEKKKKRLIEFRQHPSSQLFVAGLMMTTFMSEFFEFVFEKLSWKCFFDFRLDFLPFFFHKWMSGQRGRHNQLNSGAFYPLLNLTWLHRCHKSAV